MPTPLKIFIAYAHKDEEFLNELWERIRHLERSQLAEIWYDGKLEPGVDWDQVIKDNLNQSDIILLLVSPTAIASEYFFNQEVKGALELHKQGIAKVIPFILRPCDWKSTDLGQLQALPKNGKAITLWENRDIAYKDSVDWIRTIIKKGKARVLRSDRQNVLNL